MEKFSQLMALSATHTRQTQNDVQQLLEARRRKDAEAKKKQEEKERQEKEQEARRRKAIFEREKKEKEEQQKRENAAKALEATLQRREEEQRNRLLGKKPKPKNGDGGAPKWPGSSSSTSHRKRSPDNTGTTSSAIPLTREELRQKKLDAEQRKLFIAPRRTTTSNGYKKNGRRLPGGAVDITSSASHDFSGSGSIKDKIKAMPNTLTKLNVNKRDVRTIDEIVNDISRTKQNTVLQGSQALAFDDWFSDKKKQTAKTSSTASGSKSPDSRPVKADGAPPTSLKRPFASSSVRTSSSLSRPSTTSAAKRPLSTVKPTKGGASSTSMSSGKKRPRDNELEYPSKRRAVSEEEYDDDEDEGYSGGGNAGTFQSEIWKIFGRDRSKYTSMDVLSDDEDMEADASFVENEEARSARLARREDELALREEKRHEALKAEKRRKAKTGSN